MTRKVLIWGALAIVVAIGTVSVVHTQFAKAQTKQPYKLTNLVGKLTTDDVGSGMQYIIVFKDNLFPGGGNTIKTDDYGNFSGSAKVYLESSLTEIGYLDFAGVKILENNVANHGISTLTGKATFRDMSGGILVGGEVDLSNVTVHPDGRFYGVSTEVLGAPIGVMQFYNPPNWTLSATWEPVVQPTQPVQPVQPVQPTPPIVGTLDISRVTGSETSSINARGIVAYAGDGATLIERGFAYRKLSSGDSKPERKPEGGTSLGFYNLTITDLDAGAQYEVRAYAENSAGVGTVAAPLTVITEANPPIVITGLVQQSIAFIKTVLAAIQNIFQ